MRGRVGSFVALWLGGFALVTSAASAQVFTVESSVPEIPSYGFAIDGETYAIGRTSENRVLVYVRSGTTWTLQQQIGPSGIASATDFGWAIAIDGDRMAITALRDGAGSVRVFARVGSVWTQEARLMAPSGSLFGVSVALQGSTLVVGPYGGPDGGGVGAAFVYTRSGTTWSLAQTLHPSAAGAYAFGIAVSLSGDRLAVGARMETSSAGAEAGAVYVYERSGAGTPFVEAAHILPPAGTAHARFGEDVAVDGDRLVVSAPGGVAGTSSAYGFILYELLGGTWTQVYRGPLEASGFDVLDIEGSTAVMNASVVEPDVGGAWSVTQTLARNNAAAISGDTILTSNTVYRRTAPAEPGRSCTTGLECASTFCVSGHCCASACADGCGACARIYTGQADGTCAPLRRGTSCRTAVEACDVSEECDGVSTSCPPDVIAPAGRLCRSVLGPCDVAETCDGVSIACPPDLVAEVGVLCRGVAGACDQEERCTGASTACPNDAYVPRGTICRPANGTCDPAEFCSGSSASCPMDAWATNGTTCTNTLMCDGADRCQNGACVPGGSPLACDDGDACTADGCSEPDGCMHAAVADCCNDDATCMDADDCTVDTCAVHVCRHDPDPRCLDASSPADAAPMDLDAGQEDASMATDAAASVDARSVDDRDAQVTRSDASGADGGTPRTGTRAGCGCSAAGRQGPGPATLFVLALFLGGRARRSLPRSRHSSCSPRARR